MDRLRQVSHLWNWLPAFRVVAETQHLPTASEALGVSPSALSRTIGLLEDQLGQPLFRRAGRRLELNETGEQLLAATRDAMRRIHGSMELVADEHTVGPVLISSVGGVGPAYLVHALAHLKAQHPQLVPRVRTVAADLAPGELLQGSLDIAFTSMALRHPRLTTEHIGNLTNGLYCGVGHPLHDRPDPTMDEILAHEFCVPTPDERGLTHEGWPATVHRKVGAELAQMNLGIHLCATGQYLAVLPEAVVASMPQLGLRRIPVACVEHTPIFAIRRPLLGDPGKAELVLDAVHRVMALEHERRENDATEHLGAAQKKLG